MPASGAELRLSVRRVDGGTQVPLLNAEGTLLTGCEENGRYEFQLPDSLVASAVLVDDVPLNAVSGATNCWSWQPGFYAGSVVAEVFDGMARLVGSWTIDVSPHPAKLGRDVFLAMVRELHAFDPRLVFGDSPAHSPFGAEGRWSDPFLRYARLKANGLLFVEAMKTLARAPQRQLVHRRELTPLHQARSLDVQTVLSAARSATAIAALGLTGNNVESSEEVLFDVPSSYRTEDSPANRTMLARLLSVLRNVRDVRTTFVNGQGALAGRYSNEALQASLPARIRYLEKLEEELRGILRRSPFDRVRRAEVSATGLNAVAANPDYGKAAKLGWRAIRPGIEGAAAFDQLPMGPTWQVFERWAFLQLVKASQALLPGNALLIDRQGARDDCFRVTLDTDKGCLAIHLQPRFPAFDQGDSHGFRSVSAERYPDLVVTWQTDGVERFVVFDAKYRVSRYGVLDGMESAHLYRDSLRYMGVRPSHAFLLTPAPTETGTLEADDYFDAEGVGIIPLNDAAQPRLIELLRRHLLA
ncbi:nuclease domain-containing protein [Acidovorax facilis]|uniref:Nuclease domain-containing protein n=1 Tax=Acidovorax facilis TaxID=12917 RepID=A0ABV8D985_9BURK|nr:nuclease domain-containing protein [Acidovorax facilis]